MGGGIGDDIVSARRLFDFPAFFNQPPDMRSSNKYLGSRGG